MRQRLMEEEVAVGGRAYPARTGNTGNRRAANAITGSAAIAACRALRHCSKSSWNPAGRNRLAARQSTTRIPVPVGAGGYKG